MSFTKSRAYSVLYMFALSALFAGLLSLVKVVTAEQVADNERTAASKNLVRVFELMEITPQTTGAQLADALTKSVRPLWIVDNGGPKLVDAEPDKTATVLYRLWLALDDAGRPRAFAFPIGGKGFWGPIFGLMAVAPDGLTIRNIVWTRHGETPGLGARIEEDQYRAKFKGKQAADPAVARFRVVPEGTMGDDPHAVDQITGATQTTVVGMGKFLNDNFAQWHRYLPLLLDYLRQQGLTAPQPSTAEAPDGQE
ncbi:MAG TPA: FMN-binding protein [bacterium]|nr:FMN-binding protein [bacterium]